MRLSKIKAAKQLDFLKSVSDKTILIPPAHGFVRYPEAKIYINFPRTQEIGWVHSNVPCEKFKELFDFTKS